MLIIEKSEASLSKYGHSVIEPGRPEVKTWGRLQAQDYCGRGGGIQRSVEGLQGFGMSLSAFLNSLQSDGHFEVSQSCLNPA